MIPILFGSAIEERVFSLWFAVVPSYSSLPKGEDYSLKSQIESNAHFSSRALSGLKVLLVFPL